MTFQAFVKRVLTVVFILLLLTLWYLRNTLLLVFAAVVIAVGLSLPARRLQRFGLGRGWSNLVAATAVGLVSLILIVWLVPTLVTGFSDLLAGLSGSVNNLAEVYNRLRIDNETLGSILPPVEVDSSSSLTEAEIRNLLEQALNTGLPVLISGGGAALSVLTNVALVLFIALLLLADPLACLTASLYLVPKHRHARVLGLWAELYRTLKTWLTSLFISITITVLLVWIVLGLLGMPHVAVVAAFAGFATFVPNIGAFLPLIPIAVFTLATNPASFLVMAPAYLAIQLLESNVLTPTVVKRQLSIPAAGTLVVQIVAGLVFGLLGVLLAVPLLAVSITLIRELYSYDALGLRGARVNVTLGRDGQLRFLNGGSPTGGGFEERSGGRQLSDMDTKR